MTLRANQWGKSQVTIMHCLNGHEYTDGSYYLRRYPHGKIYRKCKRCARTAVNRYAEKVRWEKE